MTNLSVWARLAPASASVHAAGARDEDHVLSSLAAAARMLANTANGWAATLDGDTVRVVRSAIPDRPSPPFRELLGPPHEPVVRGDAFLAVRIPGPGSARAGVVVLPLVAADGLDAALVELTTVGGLALECARLRQRLESVVRGRELLMGSVSHDLRNPLNTFAMSAGLLRDDLERNEVDTTRGLALVSRMDRATARMQAIIEDLVEASRVDARKVEFTRSSVKAAALVRDAVSAATRAATSEKSAGVAVDDVDDDVLVMADRGRTLQLLSKVVAFATTAAGDGGAIRIGVRGQGESVVFTARAFGPKGMLVAPPEQGRAGLALLLARGLAEAQHGSLDIESEGGLVLLLTLPAAKT